MPCRKGNCSCPHQHPDLRAPADNQRKCLTPDALTVCKRCADQGLECEYQKHRRGRRKKNADDGPAADSQHQSSRSRSRSPSHLAPSPPRTGHLVEREREPRSAPTSAQIRSHSIRFSHVVPIEGDSTRMQAQLFRQADDSLPPPTQLAATRHGWCEPRAIEDRLPRPRHERLPD